MSRVGVDIDGVLYPFEDNLRKYLRSDHYPYAIQKDMPEPTRWEFYLDWGMSLQEFIEACHKGVDDGVLFWEGAPYPGVKTELDRLKRAGHTIVLISNRDFGEAKTSERATRQWLSYHEIPYHELHLVKDKTTVDVDYHIDDNVLNHADMCGVGTRCYLLRQPWNADHECGLVVTSLGEYVNFILADQLREYGAQADRSEDAVIWKAGPKVAHPDGGLVGQYRPEVRVTSSTGGQKGKKLARFDLIPPRALWQVAELYGKGAEKYDDWNWRKGYDWSLSIAALERHLSLFKSGEDYDDETEAPHLTSVVFHALALLTFMEEQPDFDDRHKP